MLRDIKLPHLIKAFAGADQLLESRWGLRGVDRWKNLGYFRLSDDNDVASRVSRGSKVDLNQVLLAMPFANCKSSST